jgi:hypothetical protein
VTTTNRLIAAVRDCCLSIPDKRQGQNTTYAMADFGMAAFSAFFMQSPSFLAHQRHLAAGRGRSNCRVRTKAVQLSGEVSRYVRPVTICGSGRVGGKRPVSTPVGFS